MKDCDGGEEWVEWRGKGAECYAFFPTWLLHIITSTFQLCLIIKKRGRALELVRGVEH